MFIIINNLKLASSVSKFSKRQKYKVIREKYRTSLWKILNRYFMQLQTINLQLTTEYVQDYKNTTKIV